MITLRNNDAAAKAAETRAAEENAPFEATPEQIAAYLADGYWAGRDEARRTFDVEPGGTLTANITGLTAEGQQRARWALEAWTHVTGIHFRFVRAEADLNFDDAPADAASARRVVEGARVLSSHVKVPVAFLETHGATLDGAIFRTCLQETGHALGLGHAGPGGAGDSASPSAGVYGSDNLFLNDSWPATVRSGFDQAVNTHIGY